MVVAILYLRTGTRQRSVLPLWLCPLPYKRQEIDAGEDKDYNVLYIIE